MPETSLTFKIHLKSEASFGEPERAFLFHPKLFVSSFLKVAVPSGPPSIPPERKICHWQRPHETKTLGEKCSSRGISNGLFPTSLKEEEGICVMRRPIAGRSKRLTPLPPPQPRPNPHPRPSLTVSREWVAEANVPTAPLVGFKVANTLGKSASQTTSAIH